MSTSLGNQIKISETIDAAKVDSSSDDEQIEKEEKDKTNSDVEKEVDVSMSEARRKKKRDRKKKKKSSKKKSKEHQERKNRNISSESEEEEEKKKKLLEAVKAEEKRLQQVDRLMRLDERKRPYNSMVESKAPDEEELEAYYMKRKRDEDPMAFFK